jgi:Ca-activated chloride channel family protein
MSFFSSVSTTRRSHEHLTNSVEDLQSRLLSASAKGSTALFDAIYLNLSEMRSARNAKRASLIISDGGDNHCRYNEKDIKRLVREADTQLYAVGVFDPLQYRGRTPEELNGPSLLSEVTELTGGRVFDVKNLNELPDIAAKISAELRNQYILGYRPSNKSHDARWRKIKVKLRAPKGLPPLKHLRKNRLRCAQPLDLHGPACKPSETGRYRVLDRASNSLTPAILH